MPVPPQYQKYLPKKSSTPAQYQKYVPKYKPVSKPSVYKPKPKVAFGAEPGPPAASKPALPAPKTGVYATWDRYALDPEEVNWLAGKTLIDKKASGGLTDRAIQETSNWWWKNQRPPSNPSAYTPWADQKPTTTNTGGGYYYGGGGGGGGGSAPEPKPITWSAFDTGVKGPSWWKAMKPSEMTDESEYIASINMLIPYLSPEDQKTVAATLYQMDAKNFGHLNPENISVKPLTEMDDATRLEYTKASRSASALGAMSELAKAVGKKDEELGPGYRYLRSILDAGSKFGASANALSQTRSQYRQMMSALDPLISQSQNGSLAPYSSMVNMLSRPFFSGGQLVPVTRTQDGRFVFGEANKRLL